MKRVFFSFAIVALLMSGCYKDDINDLKDKYKDLQEQLDKQAQDYQTILNALANQLTVTAVVPITGGYSIVFSDGSTIQVKDGNTPVFTVGENGNWHVDGEDTGAVARGATGETPEIEIKDGFWWINGENTNVKAEGNNGANASVITAIVIQDGEMTFTFSEGNPITVPMEGGAAPYIVSIVEVGGIVTYYYSDGSTVTMLKTTETVSGMFVLSEGYMGAGNGQLAFFDYNSTTDKFVRNDAKRFQNYGETPNDLMVYGSKIYVAITGANNVGGMVRVINPATGQTIKDIVITEDAVEQMPRRLAATNGKVYVTLYSGAVAEIDTAFFACRVTELAGTYSEGICAYGTSLYICNSGQGEENTISVVSIASFTETDVIDVPYNPVNIVSVGNNELYFSTASAWSGPAAGAPANLHVLDVSSKTVTHTFNIEVESIAVGNGYVYSAATDWDTYGSTLKKIDISTQTVSEFTDDPDDYMMGYKLSVNPLTNEVFLTDMGQYVYRFEEDGTYIETLTTGAANGAAVVFVNTVQTTYSIIE